MKKYSFPEMPTKAETAVRTEKALNDLFGLQEKLGGPKDAFVRKLNAVGGSFNPRSMDNWRLGEWQTLPDGAKSKVRRRSRPRAETLLSIEETVARLKQRLRIS